MICIFSITVWAGQNITERIGVAKICLTMYSFIKTQKVFNELQCITGQHLKSQAFSP